MSVYYLNTEVDPLKPDTHSVEDQVQTQSEAQAILAQFWPKVTEEIRSIRNMDLKQQILPLARIKKIMKLDEDVKMISSEAPLLFAKAAEIFVQELTLRAWIHTEDNKRRTLQRNDIAMAISKYDQFDFLIDIVPRDDIKPAMTKQSTSMPPFRDDTNVIRVVGSGPGGGITATNSTASNAASDQVYYFQLAQQHHANLAQQQQQQQTNSATAAATSAAGTIQVVQSIDGTTHQQPIFIQSTAAAAAAGTTTTTVPTVATAAAAPTGNVQLLQQVVTPSGEIQQIPITLTAQQLQLIKMQLQSNNGQPLIIHTAPSNATAGATAAVPQHIIQVATASVAAPTATQTATVTASSGQTVFITQTTNGSSEGD